MKIFNSIRKLFKILNPMPPIGGFTISDASLRFLLLRDNKKLVTASLRLPPGILKGGRIMDYKNFSLALKKIHSQISPFKKPVNIIVNLPSLNVYSQSFSIPLLAEEKIKEAAELNLRMISPIDFKTSYSDYQEIGENFSGSGKIYLLGAFTEAKQVDEYVSALEEANFEVLAVEFPGLAISRLVAEEMPMDSEESYLLLDVSDEGVNLMIMRNSKLYFSHFHSWDFIKEESGGKEISHKDFEDFMAKEIQKLLNFSSSRWGGTIAQAILISTYMSQEIIKVVENNFSMKIKNLSIKDYSGLESFWFSTLGSAMRGLTPRQEDNSISLTSATVRSKYMYTRILNFISMWRKIAITVIVFILVVSGAVDFFLTSQEKRLKKEILSNQSSKEVLEVQELQKKAKEFNNLVSLAAEAKKNSSAWSKIFELIQRLAGKDLLLKKISAEGANVLINGSGKNEETVLNFKLRLENERNFKNISLPLANIKSNPDGSADFSLSFKLASFKF